MSNIAFIQITSNLNVYLPIFTLTHWVWKVMVPQDRLFHVTFSDLLCKSLRKYLPCRGQGTKRKRKNGEGVRGTDLVPSQQISRRLSYVGTLMFRISTQKCHTSPFFLSPPYSVWVVKNNVFCICVKSLNIEKKKNSSSE